MRIRKNIRSLTPDEKRKLVDALLILKKRGRYDEYVHWHHHAMIPSSLPWEPRDPAYRNRAHRGPAFLPWHREFLLQLEADLQAINNSITIPYWDWTQDAAMPDPTKSPLWSDDFMGGNGVEADNWRVGTGPFAWKTGNWPIPNDLDGPALTRRFGSFRGVSTLPTTNDLVLAMNEVFYDTPNFNNSPFTIGFRNRLEGWVTQRGDSRVKTPGSQLHNRVHLWIGGMWEKDGQVFYGSMYHMTSPNDPVFFLHHCFVDKVWADWQAQQQRDNPSGRPHYAPESGGPAGHNIDDKLEPWDHTIREVLDITQLDYAYEDVDFRATLATVRAKAARGPFVAE